MKLYSLLSLRFLLMPIGLCLCLSEATASVPSNGHLTSVAKIWDQAPHNAFTDLIQFDGEFYTTFREASQHLVPSLGEPGGIVRLLNSPDGNDWNSVATFSLGATDHDLRDPKLTITPNNQLELLATDVPSAGSGGSRQSYAWFSSNGSDWSAPNTALNDSRWLWRSEWDPTNNVSYGISYTNNSTRLHASASGASYGTVVPTLIDGNEAGLLFLENGAAVTLVRREGAGAQVGVSSNLTDWSFQDTGVFVGGPDLIQIPDGRIVVGGRFLDNFTSNPRTSLGFLDPTAGTIQEFLRLPSGGDTGYPGLSWHDDQLWVSYYSSHENSKASVYLAKVSFSSFTDTFSREDQLPAANSLGTTENGNFTYLERGNTAAQPISNGTAYLGNNQLVITGSQQGALPDSNRGGAYLSNLDQADLNVSMDVGFSLASAPPSGNSSANSNKFNNTFLLMLRSREDQNFGSNNALENGLVAVEFGPNGDLLIREQTGAGASGLSTVQGSYNFFTDAAASRQPLPGSLPATYGYGNLDLNQNGFLDADEMVNLRAELEGTSLRVFLNGLQYGPTFSLTNTSATSGQASGVGLHKNRLGSSSAFAGQVASNILIDNFNFELVSSLLGDFNGDNKVDELDLVAWQTSYGVDAGADANGDGNSDGLDFLTWQQQFGVGAAANASSQAIAEPSTGILLAATVACGLLIHRGTHNHSLSLHL